MILVILCDSGDLALILVRFCGDSDDFAVILLILWDSGDFGGGPGIAETVSIADSDAQRSVSPLRVRKQRDEV